MWNELFWLDPGRIGDLGMQTIGVAGGGFRGVANVCIIKKTLGIFWGFILAAELSGNFWKLLRKFIFSRRRSFGGFFY